MKPLLRTVVALWLTLASAVPAEPPRKLTNTSIENAILPVIITGGEWTTTIVINNLTSKPKSLSIAFASESEDWPVDIKGLGRVVTTSPILPPRGSVRLELEAPAGAATQVGFAIIVPDCDPELNGDCTGVGVYTLLRNHNLARAQDFEVSYQPAGFDTMIHKRFAFDQSNYSQMVVNFTNVNETTKAYPITIYGNDGSPVFQTSVSVPPFAVRIVNFAALSPQTWNVLGWLDVGVQDVDLILSGHRINETGSFTPLYSYDNNMGLDDAIDIIFR